MGEAGTAGTGAAIGARARGVALRVQHYLLLLAIGDAAIALAALLAVVAVWSQVPGAVPTELFEIWLLGTWLLWLVALRAGGAYDLLAPEVRGRVSGALVRALLIVVAATLTAYFLAPRSFPRSTSLLAPLPVFAALAAFRAYAGSRAARSALFERRVVLLGIDASTRGLARLLAAGRRPVPYVPVAFVAGPPAPRQVEGVPVLEDPSRLLEHVRASGAREVVIAPRAELGVEVQAALAACAREGIAIEDARELHEHVTARVLVEDADASWFAIAATPYAALKRAGDAALAALLVVLLAPVYAAIAAAILLDDGRPVLFHQSRLGLHGRPFTIHKFRSMRRDAEAAGPRYAARSDPRTTRVGRLLRPIGLDELPQLVDVLRGRMSLIGPRPERPEHVSGLARRVPLYWARHRVRPGLVGWAEVHVPHAVTDEGHLARLEYDLYYVKHASPLLDANVALRTISLLLGRRR